MNSLYNLYSITIDSVASDNESSVLKAVRESVFLQIRCMELHGGNLFVKDVRNQELYNSVHEILVIFTNVKLQSLILLEGGSKIYIKGATR
jgi:hypothetical protein